MNLQQKLLSLGKVGFDKSVILATDDSFVTDRMQGEDIYDSAKISEKYIAKEARKLYNK